MYDKITQMKPEQHNHWIDIPELSYWAERFFAEFDVASSLAEPREQPILENAIDRLYDSFCRHHALTDAACQEAEEALLPFSQRAKAYNLHCVAHAHIDMDWLWGLHETVDITLSTFRTMLDLMEEYPDFTYSQSQCAVYKMAKFYDPVLFRQIGQRVREGRWEFAGSSWVELDKNMPSLESMARHILCTKAFLKENFGIEPGQVNLDFHPDSFGHSADVPAILNAGGVHWLYHCRGLDGEYLYRWQGADGAELLTLNEPLWYNDSIRPMYLGRVPKFCKQYGIRDMMKVYGVGDHGGGPTRKDVERIMDMQSWPVAPRIFFSTYRRYFESLEPYRESLPVLTGELGPTFTGCYTSQSRIKQANRIAEDRLFLAESLTALACQKTGMEDFNRQLSMAWERVLFNQFHDILPGTNVPPSRDHALGAFEEALGAVMASSGAALRAMADSIDTSCFETPAQALSSRSEGGGVGLNTDEKHRFRLPGVERGWGKTRLLHFFNPTGFDREQVLEATLWDWPGDAERIQAFDLQGNPLPAAAKTLPGLEWNHIRTDVLLCAKVPALGYTTVRITEGEKQGFCFCALPPDPRVTYYPPLVLENDLVKVVFHAGNLSVQSYVNKKAGKGLLGSQGGRFFLYRERNVPRGGCAWVEGVHTDPRDLHRTGKALLKAPVTGSALRQELEYCLKWDGSEVSVKASLDKDSPVLELAVTASLAQLGDQEGTPKLSFRLDLGEAPAYFLSDSQIGLQKRALQSSHDCCSRNFLFAPMKDTGLALLTDSKYGYRGYENKMEVSLLRASTRPDPGPELGSRFFRIGIAQAPGTTAGLKELGEGFALRDLPYASNRAHKGTLPLQDRLLTVRGAQVTALKKAGDGRGLILRLAALEGGEATVAMPGLKEAFLTDLAEQDLHALPPEGDSLRLSLPQGTVKTLRLILCPPADRKNILDAHRPLAPIST